MSRSLLDIDAEPSSDATRDALARLLAVDAATPLRIEHVGPLTLGAVSIAAIRDASERTLGGWAAVHLDERERITWAAMRVPKRRFEWLAGRVAAKWCVSARMRREHRSVLVPREVFVRHVSEGERRGAPYVAHPCCLSLSHSGDIAVAVAHAGRVGVDVERVRPVSDDLLRFAFTPQERATIRNDRDAILGWTSKEALLKACGVGLRVPMRDITVRLEVGPLSWKACGPSPALEPLRLADACGWAGILGGYAAALAWWPSPK